MGNQEYKPSQSCFSFLICFAIGYAILFGLLTSVVGQFMSARAAHPYGVSNPEFRGNLLIFILVAGLLVALGRLFGRDATFYVLGPTPKQYSRTFLVGILCLAILLLLALGATASWSWPYEYYSRLRALCAGGLTLLAFGAWDTRRLAKAFSIACASLAIVFVVATMPRDVWNIVNFSAAYLAALAGLVAVALLWPHSPKPERGY